MNAEQVARNCLATYVHTKKARCASAGGPVDLAPMVEVVHADGTRSVGIVPTREGIGPAVAAMREGHDSPVAFVAFLADAVARELDPEVAEAFAQDGRGSVLAAFHAGDVTIEERLNVVVLEVDGDYAGAEAGYGFDDRGRIRFRPVEVRLPARGETIDGGVMDELRAAVPS